MKPISVLVFGLDRAACPSRSGEDFSNQDADGRCSPARSTGSHGRQIVHRQGSSLRRPSGNETRLGAPCYVCTSDRTLPGTFTGSLATTKTKSARPMPILPHTVGESS